MAEAGDDVVVHHSNGLHEGVANCGSHKIEAAFFQGFAHGVGLGAARGKTIDRLPGIYARAALHKLPNVAIEAAALFLHLQKGPSISHRRCDLQAVAHDAGIFQQLRELATVVTGNALGLEIVESGAIVFAFVQNRFPTQAGLRSFQN
jgi:hypothetical protein